MTASVNPGDRVEVVVQQWLAAQERLQSRHLEGTVVDVRDRSILLRGRGVVREADACLRCHLPIDHVASRLIGYGPICCERLGIDWIAKADSLTSEQIAAVRESVARATTGEWWLPLKGLRVERHEQIGTPKAGNEPVRAKIEGKTALVTLTWGCENFAAIKDAIKDSGGRWDGLNKRWTVSADRIGALAQTWSFPVEGELPVVTAPAPPKVERTVDWTGREFTLGWPKSDPEFAQLLSDVRSIAGRTFNGTTFRWHVSAAAVAEVRSLVERYRFVVLPAAAQWFERQLEIANKEAALRAASHQAESAYDLGFSLPAGLAPRPYQSAYVEYLEAVGGRAICADEMGLGKTIESLLGNHKLGGYPLLVVAPASVLLNWKREFNRFLPSLHVEVLHGRRLSVPPADVYVTNYESLSVGQENKQVVLSLTASNIKARAPKGLIVDEAYNCKTPTTARTRAVEAIAVGTEIRQALSGTPIPNRANEIKAQIGVVGLWGKFPGGARRFDLLVKLAKWEELNDTLRAIGYVRRLKSAVQPDLPAKTYATVDITEWESGQDYGQQFDKLVEAYNKGEFANQLAALTRMRTIVGRRKVDPTLAWVDDFLANDEGKLVVTAIHQEVQQALLARIQAKHPEIVVAHIFAKDSIQVRQQQIDLFQNDPRCRVIVISLKAGGIGITLTAASNLYHTEQDWVPANMDQASDRIHRDGQRLACTIYEALADDSIDTILKTVQWKKLPEIGASTQGLAPAQIEKHVVQGVIAALVAQYRSRQKEVA